MKILELKLKKDVIIVDIPIDAKNIYLSGNSVVFNTNKSCIVKSLNGNYEFLCKGSELTEEIASELVDETIMYEKHKVKCYRYRSYREGFVAFDNAVEAVVSAVESKGFYWLKNPIEKPINRDEYYRSDKVDSFEILLKEWQEAEEKTFRNPLIFVKK